MFDYSGVSSVSGEIDIYIILFATVLTIVLSLLLVFTYDMTTPVVARSHSFVQSLLLMSTVTCTIMQSIGDSLALSFGIFGALAIIRFRSAISDPRDIAFIFATMAVGIGCGVHSYQNAVIGTIAFCLIIFILTLTPFDHKYNIKGNLRIDIAGDINHLIDIENILSEYTRNSQLSKYRLLTVAEGIDGTEYEYSFMMKTIKDGTHLQEKLKSIEGIKVTRLSFENNIYTSNNT